MRFTDLYEAQPIPVEIDYSTEDYEAGASGYVVDSMAEQVENWLYRNDVDPKWKDHIREYDRVAFFNNLWVDEEAQGQHIGVNMLDDFVNEAADNGAEAIYLIADRGESQREGFELTNFYERNGFEKIEDTVGGPLMKMILI